MKTVVALALVFAALALAFVFVRTPGETKDLVVRQRTVITGVGARTSESTQYWSATRMIVDEPNARMIVDFADKKLTSIDKSKRTYIVLTFADMKAQMGAARKEMEERTADYPDDAKAQLERMGEAIGDPNSKVEVKPLGKREKIAGYDAEEYEFSGSATHGSLWISKELPLPLGPAEMQAFRESTEGMKNANRQFALAMAQTKSLPLRTVMSLELGPDGTTMTNEVFEVRHESAPPDVIGVPAEFTPMKLAAPTPAAAE